MTLQGKRSGAPLVAAQPGDGRHIRGLFGVGVQGEVLGDLPEEDLAVVRGRRDERVVEGRPVGVEDGGRVSAEQRQHVGGAAALVDGDDGKGTASAGLPVDGNVFGVGLGAVSARAGQVACAWADLDQVGVPGILADAQVIVALFLGPSAAGHGRRGACRRQRTFLVPLPKTWPGRGRQLGGAGHQDEGATHDTWRRARIGRPLRSGKNDGWAGPGARRGLQRGAERYGRLGAGGNGGRGGERGCARVDGVLFRPGTLCCPQQPHRQRLGRWSLAHYVLTVVQRLQVRPRPHNLAPHSLSTTVTAAIAAAAVHAPAARMHGRSMISS